MTKPQKPNGFWSAVLGILLLVMFSVVSWRQMRAEAIEVEALRICVSDPSAHDTAAMRDTTILAMQIGEHWYAFGQSSRYPTRRLEATQDMARPIVFHAVRCQRNKAGLKASDVTASSRTQWSVSDSTIISVRRGVVTFLRPGPVKLSVRYQ